VYYEEGRIVLSRKLIKKQPGRRWLTYLAAAAVVVTTFGLSGAVLAVHDDTFQLDGDTTKHAYNGSGTVDWNDLFNADGSNTSAIDVTNDPGFTNADFVRDFSAKATSPRTAQCDKTTLTLPQTFCTSDATTFATGSKDTLNMNPGWQCNKDNNVNSKIDIMNAYAAAFTAASGDKILYFGLDKNKDNGTNDAGFWFLQGDANCAVTSTSGAHPSFTGTHKLGDVLVVAEYSTGGGVGNITAYRWVGGSNPLTQIATAAIGTADCKDRLAGDSICGTTNSGAKPFNTNITTSWLTSDATLGVGNTVVPPDFFEGGIDITAAFAESDGGTAPTCFNTYIADTRSSTSLTATLFDFARGKLGECKSTTTTTPVDATDNTQPPASTIPADPADAKVLVKDKTVITVTGVSSFTGSISWHICGPTASSSTQLCDGTTGNVGVDLGSQSITAAGTYYSPTATVTSAGRYCFRAEFSGDDTAGVPPSSDSSANECFTVAPVTPTVSTQAGAGTVDFGSPVTDTATLTGTAHKPGTGGPAGSNGSINPTTLGGDATGNITFTLYKSDCTTLATGTGTNPQTVAITGDGSYGPVSFTPDAPGTYYWDASYPGNSPNTNAATNNSPCPTDSEKVIVRTIPTTISTGPTWVPNDSATVSSSVAGNNLPAGGTLTFSLYRDTTGPVTTALANCLAGGTTGREYNEAFTVGGTNSVTKASNNSKSYSTDLTLYWRVTYAPGDTAHTGIQSNCQEAIVVDVTGDSGPGTAFP